MKYLIAINNIFFFNMHLNIYKFELSMKKNIFCIVFAFVLFSLQSNAQSDSTFVREIETDTVKQLSNVNVFRDPRLEVLDERPALMAKADLLEKRKEELGVNNIKNYAPIVKGKKVVTGSIVTKDGYRIVIYSGTNRTEAMNIKNQFMRQFPSTRSYFSYISPSYKIRVGDFADKKEAYAFMKKISSSFPTSFIVPDIVTIKNINVR